MPKVRLDPLVKFRQQQEDRVQQELVRASADTRRAEKETERLRTRLSEAGLRQGQAWELDLADAARSRSLRDLRAAETVVVGARQVEAAARLKQFQAHQRTETVRRVAERQRDDLILDSAKKETRELDELAGVRSWRQGEQAA